MNSRFHYLGLGPLLLACLGGCAMHADRLRDVRSEFYAGNLDRLSHIAQGRNAYVLANFPNTRMVGTILTGPSGGASQ